MSVSLTLVGLVLWLLTACWSATWLNTGIDYKTKVFLGITAFANLTVRLFTNNVTPAVTDTAASYTECALVSYAAVTLTPGSWSGSTSSGLSTYTYPTLTFNFAPYAGGVTIYGYFVTVPGLVGVLADVLSTPYVVPAGGGSLTLDITDSLRKF
jgi:hypothetical protein